MQNSVTWGVLYQTQIMTRIDDSGRFRSHPSCPKPIFLLWYPLCPKAESESHSEAERITIAEVATLLVCNAVSLAKSPGGGEAI
jgi:hypothetical protein